jgi:hypothetical protein
VEPRPCAATAATGYGVELLDVDVNQLAGTGALVAANRLPGQAVWPGQPVHAMPAQLRLHGRGQDPNLRADPRRSGLHAVRSSSIRL